MIAAAVHDLAGPGVDGVLIFLKALVEGNFVPGSAALPLQVYLHVVDVIAGEARVVQRDLQSPVAPDASGGIAPEEKSDPQAPQKAQKLPNHPLERELFPRLQRL